MPDESTNKTELGVSRPLVHPVYLSAVYTLPDLDTLDRVWDGAEPGFIYARDAHPNARFLAEALCAAEAAEWSVICASGMAAISALLLATVQSGGRIVSSNRLYGKTTQLFVQEMARFGVKTTLTDCTDLDQVRRALETPAQLLFVETMSNPLCRVVDIEGLARLAHERGSLLVVDNTFATPALIRPLEHGADLVMESLTKMIGGHSDVTLGLVCGRGALGPEVSAVASTWGLTSNPFDCWLAERGLTTLSLRMGAASRNAAALADWLAQQRGVSRVVYPGRKDHPDHALATRQLGGLYGNMLCFELEGGRDAVNRFMRAAPAVPFSPSLGHPTTTLSHPGRTSHRNVSPAEKARQGISDGLIRLSVGCEDLATIQREFVKGLS
jgi:cystathionine beta-lyase/cystathionine gamma-synthase